MTSTCRTCNKSNTQKYIRARDHCHIPGQNGGSPHQICNANYRLTKMIPVILEDMSHDMMQEIVTFGEKINVMSNSVEECMAFILGRNLNIIHSMHFMNSSLQNLFKNLPKDKSTYSFVPNYRGEVKLQILN